MRSSMSIQWLKTQPSCLPSPCTAQGIDFCRGGVCVRGYRYWSLYYSIKATSLNCGGAFCGMQEQVGMVGVREAMRLYADWHPARCART